jgi:hypothetical protein
MDKPTSSRIGLSIMFFVLAIALSLTIWNSVSLAAKIGFFAFGFASGIFAGQWLTKRNA